VRDLIASFLSKHKVTAALEDILKVFQGIFVDPMISLWLPKTQSELETRKSCLHADTLCRRN
jgi:hypothetical protein